MYFFCNVTTVVPHIPKERIYCLRNHNNIECGVIKATSRLTFLNFLETLPKTYFVTLFFANNVANVAHIGKFKYNTKNNCNIKCIIFWSVYQITHEKKITKKFSKISRPFTFKILGEGGGDKQITMWPIYMYYKLSYFINILHHRVTK